MAVISNAWRVSLGLLIGVALATCAAVASAGNAPRPLPMIGWWQDVVTTWDPEVELAGYHAAAAQAQAQLAAGDPNYDPDRGDPSGSQLWDQLHHVNDRWWANVDYLHWRMRGTPIPALVTRSPAATPLNQAGRLPDAEILFGDTRVNSGYRDGGRIRLGYWLVDGQFKGYQVEFFTFETDESSDRFASTAAGDILARPFFNLDPTELAEDASLLSGTGVQLSPGATYDLDGEIAIDTRSEVYSGAVTRRHVLWINFERSVRFDWLMGYRYFRLDEQLGVTDIITLNNPQGPNAVLPAGTRIRRRDSFEATNQFHGGEVGLLFEGRRGRLFVTAIGKVGLGAMLQDLNIFGDTATQIGGLGDFVPPNPPAPGGFLTQPGPGLNLGDVNKAVFATMPEFELKVALQVNKHVKATVGYNAIYANRVIRPGSQIDRNLNPTFIPPAANAAGEPGPAARFAQSYLWLHGVFGGVEATW